MGPSRTSKIVKISSKFCTMVQYLAPLRYFKAARASVLCHPWSPKDLHWQLHFKQRGGLQCYFCGRQCVRGRQKFNCLGLWRSKTICFGGGWPPIPSGRQVINLTGELWHSRTPTNEFGCHGLAGGILRISSSSDVRTVYRHIQHRAAPRPPGCKGGSVVMNQRDKRRGTGLRLDTT
jgi:hypothetical protein